MSACEDFKLVFSYIQKFCAVIGFNILNPNYKLSFMSFVVIFDIVTYNFINIYNVYDFWGDMVRCCFCMVTFSFGIQGAYRIYIFVSQKSTIQHLEFLVYEYSREMAKQPEVEDIVRDYNHRAKIQSLVFGILFWCGGIGPASYGFLATKMSGVLTLPFGFVIPFLDYTKNPGYAINYCHHIIQVLFTVNGLTLAHCILLCYVLTACMLLDIVIRKLSIIQRTLKTTDENRSQLKALVDVIQIHQRCIKFISVLEDLFSVMLLIDCGCVYFQMIVTLFVCSIEFWVPGIGVLGIANFMFLTPCFYGVYLEIKFDDLERAIYDIPWHLLPVSEQKMLLYFLQSTQKPDLLTFGSMAPVNLATCVSVYKSVYSFVMFLREMQV